MKMIKYKWLLVLLLFSVAAVAQETKEKLVYKFNIKEDITKAT